MPAAGAPTGLVVLSLVILLALLPALTQGATKVRVDFYGESLCPYCIDFTRKELSALMTDPELADIVELDYIPYGNARLNADTGELVCQHGPRECELNRLLSCALALYPYQELWFPFVDCVEGAAQSDKEPGAEELTAQCASKAGLVGKKILDCYTSQQGDDLQHRAAERTEDLRPPHQYVPWLVVNGIPLLDDYQNVLKYVCVTYTGKRPKACFEAPPSRQGATQHNTLRTCPRNLPSS